MRATGIDVSRHQKSLVDWGCMRDEGRSFAFIRSSVGLQWDPCFSNNRRNARSFGILVGQYHYLQAGVSNDKQAVNFAQSLLKCKLPPVLDVEDEALCEDDVVDFLWMFQQLTNIKPIIYTSRYKWHAIVGEGREWSKDYGLWVANWPEDADPHTAQPMLPTPWETWTFWQYASIENATTCYPADTKLDFNVFNGTEEELREMVGA